MITIIAYTLFAYGITNMIIFATFHQIDRYIYVQAGGEFALLHEISYC